MAHLRKYIGVYLLGMVALAIYFDTPDDDYPLWLWWLIIPVILWKVPPFSVGDVIYVTQSEGAKYPQYDGMTKIDAIKKVDAGWVVDTTKPRQGNTPVNSGIITNYQTDA